MGTPKKFLNHYLQHSRIVGIGGLVMLMRQGKSKDPQEWAIAYKMLHQLKALCQQYPQRFHIYGCNWTVALNHLRGLAYSADSSLAWDGARYGLIIHTRNGRLIRTSAWKLGFQGNREARCIVCARSIQRFMAQR